MVPPLELLRLPLSTELPYLNIPLFCFDSEFVPFVCLFFTTMLNTASFSLHSNKETMPCDLFILSWIPSLGGNTGRK